MTRQQAINAFCRQCICDSGNGGGTWREQVASCTSRTCPLYPHRPLPEYASGAAGQRWHDPAYRVAGMDLMLPDAFRRAFREDCKQ